MCKYDKGTPTDDSYWEEENRVNKSLMPNAGKVALDAPMSCGRGICAEIKECLFKWWLPEMTNLNQKTLAVTMLLFISVVAPTLTFGAVYSGVTNNEIGAIETILATSWVGCVYAVFGGMPMAVIGSTGPILIMTTSLKNIATSVEVPFRTFYAWVSVWILIYAFLSGFFDLTRFVRLATRFTDDVFALLIVSIFILDAIGDPFSDVGLLRLFEPDHPSHAAFRKENADYDYLTTALLSLVLGLGTTWLIFCFRGFKFSSFFCNQGVRTSLFDFAVTLSVVIWTVVCRVLFSQVDVQGLSVPGKFEPSFSCCDEACTLYFPKDCEEQEARVGVRPWFASLGDLNGKGWVPFMAAGPGLLAFLLVFLDNGITWHLINEPANKLVHGVAYNYDLVLNGCTNFVNGMLGLPWLVATTVPCIIHVNALAEKDKDGNISYTQETRLTGLFAHLLLGLVMLFLPVLKLLPLPVLYGVFLFMGLSSLSGIEFWHRFLLFFQQPSVYPENHYTKYIQNRRIHRYTVLQIATFGCVFFVQNFKPIAIAFPLMTFLCIPMRLIVLPKFFEGWELLLLDGFDVEIEEWIELKEDSKQARLANDGYETADDVEAPMQIVDIDDV